jgi:hypothetical protein
MFAAAIVPAVVQAKEPHLVYMLIAYHHPYYNQYHYYPNYHKSMSVDSPMPVAVAVETVAVVGAVVGAADIDIGIGFVAVLVLLKDLNKHYL